jgi:sortase family protein
VDLLREALTRRHLAWLATALVVASGSGCAVGARSPASGPPDSTTGPTNPPEPAQVAARVGSVVPEPPAWIRLPDRSRVPIRTVATTRNGFLDVPANVDVAGWWDGGSRLGDPFGSILVAAHVDSRTQGLGPFASLLTARPGDRVRVWSAGLTQTFAIRSRRLRPQGTIGPRSWLHSPRGPLRLTLVTCAGPYDAAAGGYQNLAVLLADPVAGIRAKS